MAPSYKLNKNTETSLKNDLKKYFQTCNLEIAHGQNLLLDKKERIIEHSKGQNNYLDNWTIFFHFYIETENLYSIQKFQGFVAIFLHCKYRFDFLQFYHNNT